MRNRLLAAIAFGVTISLVSCSDTQGDPGSESIGYGGMNVGGGAAGFAAEGGYTTGTGGVLPAGATGAGGILTGAGGRHFPAPIRVPSRCSIVGRRPRRSPCSGPRSACQQVPQPSGTSGHTVTWERSAAPTRRYRCRATASSCSR